MPRQPRLTSSAPAQEKEHYSTLEAAELLGVSFQTVARWMDRGHLTGWRTPGGHRLVSAASVHLLRNNKNPVKQEMPESSPNEGPRIQIVDDSTDDLIMLRASIASAFPNAIVSAATNAFVALLSIGQSVPDVLITDIMMPDVDGLEMIRNLRENTRTSKISVIVTSNYREKAITQRFGPLPKDVRFLGKPINSDSLREVLAPLLERATA